MAKKSAESELFAALEAEEAGGFGAVLMTLGEELSGLWAQGLALRTKLLQDGWSEEMAEHLAADWIHGLLHLYLGRVAKQFDAFDGMIDDE